MPGDDHAVGQEPGGGEGVGVRRLDHAAESNAREAVGEGETAVMVVAVEPGDDVPVPAQRGEDLGRVPGIVGPEGGRRGDGRTRRP